MRARLMSNYVLHITSRSRRPGRGNKRLHREVLESAGIIRLIDIETRERCRRLEHQIRRHCDGVDQVRIHPEKTEEVCEHCQAPWTGRDEIYNGGCCAKDELNNPTPLLGPAAGQGHHQEERA